MGKHVRHEPNYWDYDFQRHAYFNRASDCYILGEDFPEELKPTMFEKMGHLIKTMYEPLIREQLNLYLSD
jgi:hypothetical protein